MGYVEGGNKRSSASIGYFGEVNGSLEFIPLVGVRYWHGGLELGTLGMAMAMARMRVDSKYIQREF